MDLPFLTSVIISAELPSDGSSLIRYNLSVLQRSLNDSGVRIDDEKYGNENVDPRVYNGCLPGDIIKPYAFVGHWQ